MPTVCCLHIRLGLLTCPVFPEFCAWLIESLLCWLSEHFQKGFNSNQATGCSSQLHRFSRFLCWPLNLCAPLLTQYRVISLVGCPVSHTCCLVSVSFVSGQLPFFLIVLTCSVFFLIILSIYTLIVCCFIRSDCALAPLSLVRIVCVPFLNITDFDPYLPWKRL